MSGFEHIQRNKKHFMDWDESKHARDAGKFAPKEGEGKKELPRQVKGERRQAPAGGMIGINGAEYRGGWFLPSSKDTVQGAKEEEEKKKRIAKGEKKQQVAPYEYDLPPGDDYASVYGLVQDRWLKHDRETGKLEKWPDSQIPPDRDTGNAQSWEDAVATLLQSRSDTPLNSMQIMGEIKRTEAMAEAYNAGARWVKGERQDNGTIKWTKPDADEKKKAEEPE